MDGTTDLLLPFLERKKKIFRYNVDMWDRYKLQVTPSSFFIEDCTGRSIHEADCTGLYLRKPYFLDEDRQRDVGGDIQTWCQHQIRGVVDGLYEICKSKGLTRLVERHADRRLPKITQMRIAYKYFQVPNWIICVNPDDVGIAGQIVCKTLRASFVADFKSLFSTEVSAQELERGYPWFLQALVHSKGDLTVVYVARRLFPFYRHRSSSEPLDYRESSDGQILGWTKTGISDGLSSSILCYMEELGLEFGRLDFLVDSDGYKFLEVNPNGQYGWLDPENKTGLLSRVAECVTE